MFDPRSDMVDVDTPTQLRSQGDTPSPAPPPPPPSMTPDSSSQLASQHHRIQSEGGATRSLYNEGTDSVEPKRHTTSSSPPRRVTIHANSSRSSRTVITRSEVARRMSRSASGTGSGFASPQSGRGGLKRAASERRPTVTPTSGDIIAEESQGSTQEHQTLPRRASFSNVSPLRRPSTSAPRPRVSNVLSNNSTSADDQQRSSSRPKKAAPLTRSSLSGREHVLLRRSTSTGPGMRGGLGVPPSSSTSEDGAVPTRPTTSSSPPSGARKQHQQRPSSVNTSDGPPPPSVRRTQSYSQKRSSISAPRPSQRPCNRSPPESPVDFQTCSSNRLILSPGDGWSSRRSSIHFPRQRHRAQSRYTSPQKKG